MKYELFATTAKGLELLLVDELRALGAEEVAEKRAGVRFTGDLITAYRVCLWSRLANRIILPLQTVPAATSDELYTNVQTIAWDEHIDPKGTFAVQAICAQSQLAHSMFVGQKIKDAIVDQLRDQYGVRPNIERDEPDVAIYAYLFRDQLIIGLDLSGTSLHRRGYRLDTGAAPLKENLAAAILYRAGWPALAAQGGSLHDPMCGSGTLLIEAAWMALDHAPGLLREYFGFLGWKKHDPQIWRSLLEEAYARREAGMARLPIIEGYDADKEAIAVAFANLERAGLLGKVHVEKRDLVQFAPKANASPGLVVTNPPYGERLGEVEELKSLYQQLGERLKTQFVDWQAAVFTGNPDLGKQMGLRSVHQYALFNGPIACKLLLFNIDPAHFVDKSPAAENARRIRAAKRALDGVVSPGMDMLINRLKKNLKHRRKQAQNKQEGVYVVYDADLPDYRFRIEMTVEGATVSEYPVPETANRRKIEMRRQEMLAALPEALELTPEQIFVI